MGTGTVEDGKTIAIISYFSIIGFIIALLMNNDKKNDFAAFHIRQSLGLIGLWVAVWGILYFVSIPFLGWILQLGLFVMWILAFIGAIQGEKKPVPVFGTQFQEWFKGIG